MKRRRVLRAEIRGRLHLHEHDAGSRMCLPDSGNDLTQILPDRRDGRPAKTIVRAALDDDDVEISTEEPVEAAQKARGRFTAHAGVHDLEWQMRRLDFFLNELRIRAVGIEAEPGGETRTDKDHRVRPRRRNRLGRVAYGVRA